MQKQFLFVAALCAVVPTLFAQDEAKQAVPNPKLPEHEALKTLVGAWESTVKMAAMPGVEGMEQPTEVTARERAELICDGLWLKSTIDGTFMGQPFQGTWLAGYDPNAKQYISVWVDNQEPAPTEMTGSYDAKTKTWSWSGDTLRGPARSKVIWSDDDTMVETCYMTPPGGKEVQTMEITRRRAADAAAAPAAMIARGEAELPAALRELHRGIGEWRATVTMSMDPSQPATEEKATEIVRPICAGQYTWSAFEGTMMGMPFQGHSLCGYDANAGEYVSYWIDSTSANWSKTRGAFDPESQQITMSGRCLDCDGKPMTMTEVLTWKDEDTRHLHMVFDTAQGKQEMNINYVRASKE